jgi:hypothetical protein
MSYADRLRAAGPLGLAADDRLRTFAQDHGLNVEESNASLKVRGPDRRAVVLQPSPGNGVGTAGLRVQFHAVPDKEAPRIQEAIRSVGGRPEQTFSFIPLKLVVDRWPDIETNVLRPFFQDKKRIIYDGDRVRLRRNVERFPFATVVAGAIGTVISGDPEAFRVKLEDQVSGLADWDNELHWDSEVDAIGDLEPLAAESASPSSSGRVTMETRILEALAEFGAADDDELGERLGVIRQHVNQAGRRLASRGEVVREIGPNGKLINRLPEP